MRPGIRFSRVAKLLVVLGLWFGWLPPFSRAIAPPFISDADLAKYPIIVIAKWEKAPFQAHNRVENRDGRQVNTAIEAYTELNVIRVIRGDLQPGVQKVKVGYGISWDANGGRVSTGTSTDIPAAVASVAEPVIWFLRQQRSWDPKDEKLYLAVSNAREVQPLSLEKYFAVLRAEKPTEEISKLLASDDPEVLRNVLNLIGGESWPWPFGSPLDTFIRGERKPNPILGDQTAAVKALIAREKAGDVRPFAVAIYADLEGKKSVPFLRTLLADADARVRSVSAALLLQHRDTESIDAITRGITGKEDGSLACAIIEAAQNWGRFELVSALIPFLENDSFAGQIGDEVDLPALRARQALHKLTGCWFPYDVVAAEQAWKTSANEKGDRRKSLAKLLPDKEFPMKAEIEGDGSIKVQCKITNISTQPLSLTKVPHGINLRSSRGLSGAGFASPEKLTEADFITLKPGESIRFDAQLNEHFLASEPASRVVQFEYFNTGRQWNKTAWVGLVKASFGAGWKEERKTEAVEEKWPNGNLKATGQKVNGKKAGEWHYFNIYGDRIRIEDYTKGATSECNPDHPDNHGAGKREKK